MLNKYILYLVGIVIFHVHPSLAQEAFKPSGNPYARIYFNFHSHFEGKPAGFDIRRAYFGYLYNMSEKFSGDITLDVGTSEVKINDSTILTTSFHLTAFLKTAALIYKSGDLQVDVGMIGLKQFKIQEKFWGYRYIEESFQDLYELAPSADLGFAIDYKFNPAFSADFTVRNGEGYKRLQSDDALNAGFGLTFAPLKWLTLRGFYDYQKDEVAQYTIAHFIGYKNKRLSAGMEYNTQINNRNRKEQDLSGHSLYASYSINDQFKVFVRYDDLYSNKLDGETYSWNYSKDGILIISGVEFSPLENINIALNYQGWSPKDKIRSTQKFIYLNFQYTF